MRPLLFDYADDQRIWDWPRQWLLGDDLLVAPVTEPGVTTWPVYLPAGDWTDFLHRRAAHRPDRRRAPCPHRRDTGLPPLVTRGRVIGQQIFGVARHSNAQPPAV